MKRKIGVYDFERAISPAVKCKLGKFLSVEKELKTYIAIISSGKHSS